MDDYDSISSTYIASRKTERGSDEEGDVPPFNKHFEMGGCPPDSYVLIRSSLFVCRLAFRTWHSLVLSFRVTSAAGGDFWHSGRCLIDSTS
jgi:hypothetical protein